MEGGLFAMRTTTQHWTTPLGLISHYRVAGGHPPPGYSRITPPGLVGRSLCIQTSNNHSRIISLGFAIYAPLIRDYSFREPQRGFLGFGRLQVVPELRSDSPRIAGGCTTPGQPTHPRRNPGGVGRCTVDFDSCGRTTRSTAFEQLAHWTTPSGLISPDRKTGGHSPPGYSRATPSELSGESLLSETDDDSESAPQGLNSHLPRQRRRFLSEPRSGSPRIAGGCTTPGQPTHPRRNPGGVGRCGGNHRSTEPIRK